MYDTLNRHTVYTCIFKTDKNAESVHAETFFENSYNYNYRSNLFLPGIS